MTKNTKQKDPQTPIEKQPKEPIKRENSVELLKQKLEESVSLARKLSSEDPTMGSTVVLTKTIQALTCLKSSNINTG
jgi:hypothetical protein